MIAPQERFRHRPAQTLFAQIRNGSRRKNMLHSIIIPCYKSSRTIRKVVEMTAEELKNLNISEYEFVLVDD